MMLGLSPHAATLLEGVTAMVRDEIAPLDAEYFEQVEIGDRWQPHAAANRNSGRAEGRGPSARLMEPVVVA